MGKREFSNLIFFFSKKIFIWRGKVDTGWTGGSRKVYLALVVV